MKKLALILLTIISLISLTSCLEFDLGNGSDDPTPNPSESQNQVTEYTVTFMNGDKEHKKYTVEEGSKTKKPSDPIKEGYIFICWSTSQSVKNKFDFNTIIEENITLYAWYEQEEITSIGLGDVCPDKVINLINSNKKFSILDNRGKIIVINFWYTSYTPAVNQLPVLEEMYQKYNEDIVVLTIHEGSIYNADSKLVKDYINSELAGYNILFGYDTVDSQLFNFFGGKQAWPMTVIIDQSGTVTFVHPGSLTLNSLEQEITKLGATPIEPNIPTVSPTEPNIPTISPTEPNVPTVNPTEPDVPTISPTEPNIPTETTQYQVIFKNYDGSVIVVMVEQENTVSKPVDPTFEGYTFICWSTSQSSKQEFNFNTPITDNITLYAWFEKNIVEPTKYSVTFINGSSVYNSSNVIEGYKVVKPATNPSKTGYNFVCWSTSQSSKQEFDFNTPIINDIKLYAWFEEIIVEPTTYSVIFMDGSSVYNSSNVIEGYKVVKPTTNPSKAGYNFICWSISNSSKQEYNFETTISSDLTLYAWYEEIQTESSINVTKFSGYNEGAYFEFDADGYQASDFTITYSKENTSTKYTLDSELIRKSGSTIRCDILGLVKGTYNVTIQNTKNNTSINKSVYVTNHDRSGYAHFDNTSGVGAYNDDGSLKTNTIIIYVNDLNKNTVTTKFGSKTYTGLGAILAAAKNSSYPICIRILGSVKTAQWNYKDHGEGKTSARTNNLKQTFSGVSFSSGKLSYSEIVAAGINSMSNDLNNGITILNGLTTNVLYDGSEYDSYYNMLDIPDASNITIEGVGTDATIYQWGLNFKKCNNIEVKNLTFDRYTEDAVGFEGSSSDITKYGNYWVHNCTFNIGVNNWDVCYEADKYDGDGSTDFKYCRGVTVSYTTYNKTHKTILIGGNDKAKQYNFTLHHNYFNNCSSRLPLVRQANIHIYNNYYYKTTSVSSSIRANSSAFIENNYYDQAKNPFMLVNEGDFPNASLKAYGNEFNNCSTSPSSSTTKYTKANNVSNRTDSITGSCNPTGSKELINFDTNSSLFYYDSTNKVSDVENLLTASAVKEHCLQYSGVLKGDFVSDYQPDQPTEEPTPEPTPEDPSTPDDGNDDTPSTSSTLYITFNAFNEGSLSSNTTVNNVSIMPGSKTVSIVKTEKTLDGQTITNYVKFGGGGSYSGACINFDINAKANITVYYENTGSNSRYAALFDNAGGKISAETAATSSSGIVSYTFNNVNTGNYSVGSASSGLNIYLIVVEYI